MTAHLYAYAKAYFAAISAGVLYLATVIGPDITFADFAHISLLHWIGFVGSILGVGVGTAAITNGPIPVALEKEKPAVDSVIVNAAPTTFAATQAKIDALPPVTATAEVTPLVP